MQKIFAILKLFAICLRKHSELNLKLEIQNHSKNH